MYLKDAIMNKISHLIRLNKSNEGEDEECNTHINKTLFQRFERFGMV